MSTYLVKSLNLLVVIASLTACDFIKPISMDLPRHLPEAPQASRKSIDAKAIHQQPRQKPHRQLMSSLTQQEIQLLTPEISEQIKLPQNPVTINIDAMPLKDFIHLALAEILDLTFEVDASVATRVDPVTIHVTKPLKSRDLLDMVDQTLRALDVFLAWSPEGLRVLPISKASSSVPQVLSENAKMLLKLGRSMTIIPLKYASPQEALAFVRHFMDTGQVGDVSANTRLNALVVIGMPDRIAAYQQAIELIDRPSFAKKKLTLLRPVYWLAEPLAKTLTELLQAQNIPVSKTGEEHGVHLIVVKPINAVVVVSPEQAWVSLIDNWLETLDNADAIGGEENNTYLYFVKHGNAQGLGQVLGGMLSDESISRNDQPDTSESPLAAGEFSERSRGQSSFDTDATNDRSSTRARNPASADYGITGTQSKSKNRAKGSVSVVQGTDLRVIVDNERNALIFVGSSRAYQSAYNLLQQLDRMPRQILIEATVADISLDNLKQLGVEWQYKHDDGDTSGVLGTLGGLALASASGGLSYALVNKSVGIEARVRALVQDGSAKILSSPRLLTKDNEQATIQVGTQVAVVGSDIGSVQASNDFSGNPNLLRSYKYVDTGVILKFTPTILDGGQVELELSQEVSEADTEKSASTPPIFKRLVETVMVADSGQTIMIGGLITHNEARNETKVPLLGDIPWLGHLFKYETRRDRVTEMVILITPHVINSSADAAYLTDAFQKQLHWEAKE